MYLLEKATKSWLVLMSKTLEIFLEDNYNYYILNQVIT